MNRYAVLSLMLGFIVISARSKNVRVEGGEVSGTTAKLPGVVAYLGIPYAAPPVGSLRWQAPEPVVAWQGVRKADQLPPMCLQNATKSRTVHYWGTAPTSEDCLYLNVWTPSKSAKDHLPVMVWLYGGGFRVGWSGSRFFDGAGLAAQGVVLVTLNYRVDVFGFLAHPALSNESDHHVSGNYGSLDQIAALEWVQKNIAAFGGDPKQVTLFGQSAGAAAVCEMMASPLAKGLFIRVIGESMGCFSEMTKLANAEQAGVRFQSAANAASIADLRAKPAEELLKITGDFPFRPIVDGYVWPKEPFAIFRDAEQNKVPVLVGSNADEGTVEGTPPGTASDFIQMAKHQYKDQADEFLKLFPADTNAEALNSFYTLSRDAMAFQERMWAREATRSGQVAYRYYFSHKSPVPDGMYEEQARNPVGAFHSAEIVYVFRNLDARPWPWTNTERKLSKTMSAYWTNFAKSGDPNGPGLPKWPATDASNDIVMEFGQSATPVLRRGLDKKQLDFFESFETRRLSGN